MPKKGKAKKEEMLLKKGAEVNAADKNEKTTLSYAADNGNLLGRSKNVTAATARQRRHNGGDERYRKPPSRPVAFNRHITHD